MNRVALKKIIEETRQRAKNTRQEKIEKKKKKSSVGDIPDFELEYDRQTKNNRLTWYNVLGWFREGVEKRISWSVTKPPSELQWGGKQRVLAKKLIDSYGDIVKDAVFYLCNNWEQMVEDSNGVLTGLPTVELLWSSRERIFPHVERGLPYVSPPKKRTMHNKKRHVGEYVKPPDNSIKHGW